jgi:hypothetical protein
MPTTRHRGIVMTQEQLMKVKIKYLEDRLTTMEKSLGRINNILGRFQMTEDKQSNDPFIRVMESGERDKEFLEELGNPEHELI